MTMKLPAFNFHRLPSYFQVWLITATNALQAAFVNRWSNSLFVVGKSVRLAMSLVFLFLLQSQAVTIAGYNTSQVMVFFLTYQLVDLVAQIFYRGVYSFGNKIRTGEFDFYLIRPFSALFRSLTGQPDINDVVFLLPNVLVMGWVVSQLHVGITTGSAILYGLLLINSFLLATAFHILVLTFGILTTEVDNIIWTYRDLSRLGQFPVSMYSEPFRSILFFIIPVGIMVTVPAQVLLNTPPSISIFFTCLMGIGFFIVSLRTWNWALKRYSSASS